MEKCSPDRPADGGGAAISRTIPGKALAVGNVPGGK